MTLSTAYIQAKLRDAGYKPRIIYSDCESNIDRIDICRAIEICYWRGLIDYEQILLLDEFIGEGEITNPDELSAALRAVAEISGYTDDEYLRQYQELDATKTAQTKLTELSEEFTVSLIRPETKDEDLLPVD